MITYYVWKEFGSDELIDIYQCVLMSFLSIWIDLVLSPIEIIALIIWILIKARQKIWIKKRLKKKK